MGEITAIRAALLAMIVLLTGCETTAPVTTAPPPAAPADPAARSDTSRDLQRYFLSLQDDLLARGLLRVDGGGPDTPFTPDDLARNFETIAFFDEYTRNGGGVRRPGRLSRWSRPVGIATEFGPSVPRARRNSDRPRIRAYSKRLARLTGHPVSSVDVGAANFTVIIAGEDDRDFIETRLRQLIPGISRRDIRLFTGLPRTVYCLVVAFSSAARPYDYTRAVALIRDEQPDLVRRACIHEEIAQGLGLANDSPDARPSIFNDDDEFALLTNQDELMLGMLYDPRLKQGMTIEKARPMLRIIARERMGWVL